MVRSGVETAQESDLKAEFAQFGSSAKPSKSTGSQVFTILDATPGSELMRIFKAAAAEVGAGDAPH